ncbi:MAG: GUN4 domain-containing protein [Nostoc sp.]|uniref:GUN4 domain-containing protein n=1 Tax=Nostoc sp. TaxID=1180 RepID=UPI002FF02CDC
MEKFDVFLAHNSLDKPEVIAIAKKLKRYNLNPWLDREQIFPGDNIHEAVFQGISQSKVGAFFISQNGLGTFQENLELGGIIQFFLKKRKEQSFRVIPILLPGVSDIPENFFYLRQWAWIKFTSLDDPAALEELIRGIRGRVTEIKAPPETPETTSIIQPTPTKIPEQQSNTDEEAERIRQQQEEAERLQRKQEKVERLLAAENRRQQEVEKLRQQEEAERLQREQEEAEKIAELEAAAERERQQEAAKQERERVKRMGLRLLRLQQEQEEAERLQRQREQENDDLSSDKGVDYKRLRDLLKARRWKEADQETLAVMLKVANREKQGWLDTASITIFPCNDLRTIDQLWVKYSNGRYGFSVQKKIWLEVGKNEDAFYARIAWQITAKWFFGGNLSSRSRNLDLTAPEGYLPFGMWWVIGGCRIWDLFSLRPDL